MEQTSQNIVKVNVSVWWFIVPPKPPTEWLLRPDRLGFRLPKACQPLAWSPDMRERDQQPFLLTIEFLEPNLKYGSLCPSRLFSNIQTLRSELAECAKPLKSKQYTPTINNTTILELILSMILNMMLDMKPRMTLDTISFEHGNVPSSFIHVPAGMRYRSSGSKQCCKSISSHQACNGKALRTSCSPEEHHQEQEKCHRGGTYRANCCPWSWRARPRTPGWHLDEHSRLVVCVGRECLRLLCWDGGAVLNQIGHHAAWDTWTTASPATTKLEYVKKTTDALTNDATNCKTM